MNKSDFISAIAAKSGFTKKQSGEFLDAMIATITETLASGDTVQLSGIGTLVVKDRAARAGINPKTKEKFTIAASKAVAFKAAKAIKEAIN